MTRASIGVALLALPFICSAQQVPGAAQMPPASAPPAAPYVHPVPPPIPPVRREDPAFTLLLQKQTAAINALAVQIKALEERVKGLEELKGNTHGQR